jgi:hypothetical protein
MVLKGIQYLVRKCRGQSDAARKSLLACAGIRHFLTRGLAGFWCA